MSKTQVRKLVKTKGSKKALRIVRAAKIAGEALALAEALDKVTAPG